jgi:hypothetical protein
VPPPPPLSALEKYYDFKQGQFMALSKGAFSLAGLIFSPLLAAILSNQDQVSSDTGAWFVAGAAAAFIAGLTFHALAIAAAAEFRTITITYPSPEPPSGAVPP